MISTKISRVSAAFLLLGGMALLFASDVIVARMIPGFPSEGAWLGQLLGAAWISAAAMNWLNRSSLLGGIYGRPVVMGNAVLYFVGAMVLLKVVSRGGSPVLVWVAFVPTALFAAVYSWLMFRGPIESDLQFYRGQSAGAKQKD